MSDDKPPFVAVSVDKMMAEYGALLKVAEAARSYVRRTYCPACSTESSSEGLPCYCFDEIDSWDSLIKAIKALDEARR